MGFFFVKFARYGLVQNLLIAIDGGKRVKLGAQFTVMNSEGLNEFVLSFSRLADRAMVDLRRRED